MTSQPPPLADLTLEYLDRLIAEGVGEGPMLEFKRDAYKSGPDGNKEFLKDVSALANTLGGLLIIGMAEKDGAAAMVTPIQSIEPDGHELRLLSAMRNGVDPPLRGVQLKSLQRGDGHVLVVRVPRSVYPPHQVTAQQTFKVYLRHHTQVSPASMVELRSLFDEVGMGHRQAEDFRTRRLHEISEAATAIQLADRSSQFVLHIQPLNTPRPFEIRTDLKIALENSGLFRPMGDIDGYTDRFNTDGLAITSGALGRLQAYVQVFRTGQLEAVTSGPVMLWKERRTLTARDLQHWVVRAMPAYLLGLERAGVSAPLVVSLSILGTRDAVVATSEGSGSFHGPAHLTSDTLLLPSVLLEDLPIGADEVLAALKPSFDPLWNAAGFAEWMPERQG